MSGTTAFSFLTMSESARGEGVDEGDAILERLDQHHPGTVLEGFLQLGLTAQVWICFSISAFTALSSFSESVTNPIMLSPPCSAWASMSAAM